MTASRVVNEQPYVSAATRKRVLAVVAHLGYKQNEAARLLKGQRAKTIGLIVPDLSDAFFATCAHRVQQLARSKGYLTLVVASERDEALEMQQAELMASRQVAGLIVVSSCRSVQRYEQFLKDGMAVIAMDRPIDLPGVDSLLVDNREGAEEAVQHLIEHGHKNILCVGYDQDVYTIKERIKGYRSRMNEAGFQPRLYRSIDSVEKLRGLFSEVLKGKDRPTAVFSLNHRTSTQMLQVLHSMNVKVPADLAIVGFDDLELAPVLRPSLTAVSQSGLDLAHQAATLLFDHIQKRREGLQKGAKTILPTRLLVRESCGCHTPK
jgi:LacI family transcriptional regulator